MTKDIIESPKSKSKMSFFNIMKRKRAIAIVIVLTIFVLIVVIGQIVGARGIARPVTAEPLTLRTLSNTVSTTGMVESTNKASVYSQQSYAVKTVNYAVGDTVQEGDILCELDTDSLLLDIEQQKASINASAQSSQHQLNTSEKNYDYTKEVYDEDLDASVRNARNAFDKAKEEYNESDDDLSSLSADVKAASTAYSTAKVELAASEKALAAAEKQLEAAQKALEGVETDDPDYPALANALNKAQEDVDTSQTNLQDATDTYNTAKGNYDAANEAYADAEDTTSDAYKTYSDARKSYEAAVLSAEKNLESAKDNVTGSQISSNQQSAKIGLEKLSLQLEKSTIRSPISGTVTAVYAKEGAAGNGLLFVIEDIGSLKIVTSVKEYDIDTVELGLPVIIKSDATGAKEFTGVVSSISPTAAKANDGSTLTGTNVQFDTEISVTDLNEGLRVGMNARVSIVLEKRDRVFGIAYDALVLDENGEQIIYIAEQNEKGEYIARAIPVTTGMETDFYIEIFGDDLSEGVLVISNAEKITNGAKVQVQG